MSTQLFHQIILTLFFSMIFMGQTLSHAAPIADYRELLASSPDKLLSKDLKKIATKQEPINTLSGWITLSVDYKGENNYYEGAFLVKAPNQLHLEILDDLGQTHLRVIADGEKVYWWNAEKNQSKILKQKPKVLKKIFKLPLSIEELAAVLMNQISLREREGARYNIVGCEIIPPSELTLEFPQKKVRYSTQTHQINSLVVYKKEKKKKWLYGVKYHWLQIDKEKHSPNYPQKLSWTFKKPQVKLEMEFQNIEINQKIPEEKFDFSRWSSKE